MVIRSPPRNRGTFRVVLFVGEVKGTSLTAAGVTYHVGVRMGLRGRPTFDPPRDWMYVNHVAGTGVPLSFGNDVFQTLRDTTREADLIVSWGLDGLEALGALPLDENRVFNVRAHVGTWCGKPGSTLGLKEAPRLIPGFPLSEGGPRIPSIGVPGGDPSLLLSLQEGLKALARVLTWCVVWLDSGPWVPGQVLSPAGPTWLWVLSHLLRKGTQGVLARPATPALGSGLPGGLCSSPGSQVCSGGIRTS